jgi:acetyltransferase-like isoleucine patch superfamily enzyme
VAGELTGEASIATGAEPPALPDRFVGAAKWLAHAVAVLIVLPGWFVYRLLTTLLPGRTVQTFQTFSQGFSIIPGTPGVIMRRAFYGLTLRSCPRNATIGFGTIFSTPDAALGDHVYIGAFCNLGRVDLADDVLLGSNVSIMSGTKQHFFDRLDVPIRKQGGLFKQIHIGRDAWVGSNAVVAADVGEQAVVAAGAVVVKPVRSRAIVGGNPARPLGERGSQDQSGTCSDELNQVQATGRE